MSELLIIFILLVPVFFVIFILNRSRKKQKRREQERLTNYLHPLLRESGLSPTYQKQLVHQHVVVDEKAGKLLLVHWKDFDFSHEWHSLADIKNFSVQTVKQSVMEEGRSKPEVFTAQIGVELTLQKTDEKRFLTFYSHLDHNIYHAADLTAEATHLCERLKGLKATKPANV